MIVPNEAKQIIMSTPMVLSLNADLKTQTRRQAGLEDIDGDDALHGYDARGREFFALFTDGYAGSRVERIRVKCPYGGPGGKLWVREGVRFMGSVVGAYQETVDGVVTAKSNVSKVFAEYIADKAPVELKAWPWKSHTLPAIHMIKPLCRHMLDVTAVRVERVQSISEADAIAEGMKPARGGGWSWPGSLESWSRAVDAYREGWKWLNGEESWAHNPWVWVVSFKPVKP